MIHEIYSNAPIFRRQESTQLNYYVTHRTLTTTYNLQRYPLCPDTINVNFGPGQLTYSFRHHDTRNLLKCSDIPSSGVHPTKLLRNSQNTYDDIQPAAVPIVSGYYKRQFWPWAINLLISAP